MTDLLLGFSVPKELKILKMEFLGSPHGLHRNSDRKTHCSEVIKDVNVEGFGMLPYLIKRITIRRYLMVPKCHHAHC